MSGKPTYRLNPGFGWKGKVYKLRETFTSATKAAARGPRLVSSTDDDALRAWENNRGEPVTP